MNFLRDKTKTRASLALGALGFICFLVWPATNQGLLIESLKQIESVSLRHGPPKTQILFVTAEIPNLYVEVDGVQKECKTEGRIVLQSGDQSHVKIRFFTEDRLYHQVDPKLDLEFVKKILLRVEQYLSSHHKEDIEFKRNPSEEEVANTTSGMSAVILRSLLECYLHYMNSL